MGLPAPASDTNTVKEPFETVLTTGIFCPAVDETGVIKIIDVDSTFEFVIVVLDPPRAAYPIKLGFRPAEVRLVPDPSQDAYVVVAAADISTWVKYLCPHSIPRKRMRTKASLRPDNRNLRRTITIYSHLCLVGVFH